MRRVLALLAAFVALVPAVVLAAPATSTAPHRVPAPDLVGAIQAALPDDGSRFGIAIEGLTSGRTVLLDPDNPFPAASLYKLGVMYAFYQQKKAGRVSVDEVLPETEADRVEKADSVLGPGLMVPAGTALQLMMTVSDNIASEMLMDRLTRGSVNGTFDALGLHSTRIHTFTAGDPLPANAPPATTAGDMLHFFEQLAGGTAVDADSNHEMLDLLLGNEVNDRIPAQLPPGTPVAHKTGDLEGILNDAGIVYGPVEPFAIVVLSSNIPDAGPPDSLATGRVAIARIARVAYDYFESPSVTLG
jgi:beta-lactamase class A